jgi:hypothetical protein
VGKGHYVISTKQRINKMISAKKIEEALKDSLYRSEEVDTSGRCISEGFPVPVIVEGLTSTFYLNSERLNKNKDQVVKWLSEFEDGFMKGTGGGQSFLTFCQTKDGSQWGGHKDCQNLLVLAIGLDLMGYCAPKEVWKALPGGMPYVFINLPEDKLEIVK